MLQSGAETYRVEDTMIRMADALNLTPSQSYVTPTGIVFQSGEDQQARLIRILDRTTDLEKVAKVNDISRRLCSNGLAADDAYAQLVEIDTVNQAYPIWMQIAAAALSSGCFTYMFKAGLSDFIPGVLCGGLGFYAFIVLHRWAKVKFFAEFVASLLIGLFAFLLVSIGIGSQLDKIIIGSVMPLVPGLLITNAVRDLMAGHLVSGLSRGAEAFLTAFAIGSGVAVLFTIF